MSIISSPPAEQKYELLKSFLTSVFGLSEPQRANALLDLNGLGDRKPSELVDSMLTLLEDHKPCFIFKQIFLRQLPEKLRVPLANSPHKTDLRMLTLGADNLLTSLGSSSEFKCSQIQSANTDAIETNSVFAVTTVDLAPMRSDVTVHANTTRVSLRRPRRKTPKRVGDNSTGFRPAMLCRYICARLFQRNPTLCNRWHLEKMFPC